MSRPQRPSPADLREAAARLEADPPPSTGVARTAVWLRRRADLEDRRAERQRAELDAARAGIRAHAAAIAEDTVWDPGSGTWRRRAPHEREP